MKTHTNKLISILTLAFLVVLGCTSNKESNEPKINVEELSLTRKSGQQDVKGVVGTAIDLNDVFDVKITPENASDKTVIWSIDPEQETLATITVTGVLTPQGAGTAQIKVTNGKISSATAPFDIEKVKITSLSLSPKTLELIDGKSDTMIVSFKPTDATAQEVSWQSSDEDIVTVDDKGKVTAQSPGEATITVTNKEDETHTASAKIQVIPIDVQGITLNEKDINLYVNGTYKLVATVSPKDASNQTITWSSEDETIATVSDEGVVTGIKTGTTKITATSSDGKQSATVTTTIAIEIKKILIEIIEGKKNTIVVGNEIDLADVFEVKFEPKNAENVEYIWKIHDSSIAEATITEEGMLTPLTVGEIKVFVTLKQNTDINSQPAELTVEYGPVTKVAILSEGPATIGYDYMLNAEVTGGTSKEVTWSIKGDVAGVSIDGNVLKSDTSVLTENTAVTVIATSKDNAGDGQKIVTEKEINLVPVPPVTSVSITSNGPVAIGTDYSLTATVEGGHLQTVTWSIKENVAGVSIDGNVLKSDISVLTENTTVIVIAKSEEVDASGQQLSVEETLLLESKSKVKSITLNKQSLLLNVGDSETLVFTISPEEATDKTVSWKSSDESIAKVNTSGEITAEKIGIATITVKTTDGSHEATTTVIVTTIEWVDVPGGDFEMGCKEGRDTQPCRPNELPLHSVQVESFKMAKYEVTNAQYVMFLNDIGVSPDGSYSGSNNEYETERYIMIGHTKVGIEYKNNNFEVKAGLDNHPARTVTWYGARNYAKWAGGSRLPTEEEWEYAARGGQESKDYEYSGAETATEVGWWKDNSDGSVHEVGKKVANELGIYDMSGNVNEWCESAWRLTYDSGESTGERALRGGSFGNDYVSLRNVHRGSTTPIQPESWSSTGFRIASDN